MPEKTLTRTKQPLHIQSAGKKCYSADLSPSPPVVDMLIYAPVSSFFHYILIQYLSCGSAGTVATVDGRVNGKAA